MVTGRSHGNHRDDVIVATLPSLFCRCGHGDVDAMDPASNQLMLVHDGFFFYCRRIYKWLAVGCRLLSCQMLMSSCLSSSCK